MLVLVDMRKGETYAELGAGFGVSTATARLYVKETVALLSARSPKLGQALRQAKRDGLHLMVLDGTLICTERIKADRPYFSYMGRDISVGMALERHRQPRSSGMWTAAFGDPLGLIDVETKNLARLRVALRKSAGHMEVNMGTAWRADARCSARQRRPGVVGGCDGTGRPPRGAHQLLVLRRGHVHNGRM
ncbi:transposase family protein [Nonomuraea fuscirosea]